MYTYVYIYIHIYIYIYIYVYIHTYMCTFLPRQTDVWLDNTFVGVDSHDE